jgi:signal transduction histidine kinase/ActR/RegA family two-component response regulator
MRVTEPDRAGQPVVFLVIALVLAACTGWAIAAGATLSVAQQTLLVLAALVCTIAAALVHVHYARSEETRRNTRVEQKLAENEERLRQAQKMEAVGQLAGGIAHDFNNLVTVIGCSVGLLAETTEPDDPRQEDLQQIKDAADRAATLTRQLLAFSRRQILQPTSVDLNRVVYDMEKMLQRVLGPHIAIRTTLAHHVGHVLVDMGQLQQVIMNLAVNARDAMPSGGTLTFRTANQSLTAEHVHQHGIIPPGEYITLAVEDSGHGIPSDVLEHLFEPFFTTKEQGKGTGLGLATVHGIVNQTGGHITVDSVWNQGTTFTLYFPCTRGERPATPPSGVRLDTETPARPLILVVDDEDAILDIGVRVLQQAGYQVYAARHGEEALSILARGRRSNKPVALVLTDVVMPVMGGRELVSIIETDYPETAVLCMSGYTSDELMRQRLVDPGMTLVHKPFELAELTTAVRTVLTRSTTVTPPYPLP